MDKKKKLMILITGLGQGGAENHLLKILPKLTIEHFIVSLTPENTLGKELEKKGERIIYLNLKPTTIISTIKKVKQIIKKEQPTIIDSYLIHANVLSRIVKPKGVKLINSVRGDYFSRNDFAGGRIIKILEKHTRKKVDLWVPNSESLKKILLQQNIPKEKIQVLPNCVDLEELKKKSKEKINWPYATTDKVLVYVGSLRKIKNIPTIIKAIKLLPEEYKLLLIGDGPGKKELKNLTNELDINKRVTFLGQKKNPAPYLAKAHRFILASFSEGMSNALLEALALGKTCVVSNIAQNRELVKEGKNGYVFATTDNEELAKKIECKVQVHFFENKYFVSSVRKNYEGIINHA